MSELIREAKRFAIIAVAMDQARLGAHYLRGAVGNFPGMGGGYKSRNVKYENDGTYDGLSVRAAEHWNKRCLGRYGLVTGYKAPPGENTKKAIKDYIARETARGLPPEQWAPYEGICYPRRIGGAGSSIYIGESCEGKRHFDCLSLVNWAIGQVLAKQPDYDVPVWEKGAKGLATVMDPPKLSDIKNADVVVRIKRQTNDEGEDEITSEHMAFLTLDGHVVEAAGAASGVVITPYKREEWTSAARIKDGYF